MAEAAAGPAAPLPSIFPGSWINGDFYIWIGHATTTAPGISCPMPARRSTQRADAGPAEAAGRALEEMLIAEGSDWFWWYGDDHSSDHDAEFDDLFRRHLRNVYAALGAPIPEELFATNITTGAGPGSARAVGLAQRSPSTAGTPVSWNGSARWRRRWRGPAAPCTRWRRHRSSPKFGSASRRDALVPPPRRRRCSSTLTRSGAASLALVIAGAEVRVLPVERVAGWRLDAIVEVQIPFAGSGSAAGSDLQFAIQIRDRSDAVLEAVPHGRSLDDRDAAAGCSRRPTGKRRASARHRPQSSSANHPQAHLSG